MIVETSKPDAFCETALAVPLAFRLIGKATRHLR